MFVQNGGPNGADPDLIYRSASNALECKNLIETGCTWTLGEGADANIQLAQTASGEADLSLTGIVETIINEDIITDDPTLSNEFIRTRSNGIPSAVSPNVAGNLISTVDDRGRAPGGGAPQVGHRDQVYVAAAPSPSYVPMNRDFAVGGSEGTLAVVLRLLGLTYDVALPQKPGCSVLGTTAVDGIIECKATVTPVLTPTPPPTPTVTPFVCAAGQVLDRAHPEACVQVTGVVFTTTTPHPVGQATSAAGVAGAAARQDHIHGVAVPFYIGPTVPVPTPIGSGTPANTPTPVLVVRGGVDIRHHETGTQWTLLNFEANNTNDPSTVPIAAFEQRDLRWRHTGVGAGLGTFGRTASYIVALDGSGSGSLSVENVSVSVTRTGTNFDAITLAQYSWSYDDLAAVPLDQFIAFRVRPLVLNSGTLSTGRGFWIEEPDTSGGGAITAFEGLRIGGNTPLMTSNTGIIQVNTSYINILAGKTTIGNQVIPTTNHSTLSVNGGIGPATATAGQVLNLSHWFVDRSKGPTPTPTLSPTPTVTPTSTVTGVTATPTPTPQVTPTMLAIGHVVILDTIAVNSMKMSTVREDPLVLGVAQIGATAAGQTLRAATTGIVTTRCTGAMEPGDLVTTSAIAGTCEKVGTATVPNSVLGTTLQRRTATQADGTVPVLLNPGTNAVKGIQDPTAGRRQQYVQIDRLTAPPAFESVGMTSPGIVGTSTLFAGANRPYIQLASAAPVDSTAGLSGAFDNTRTDFLPRMTTTIRTDTALTSRRIWAGLASASLATLPVRAGGSGTTGSALSFVAIGFEATINAGWECCAGNGASYGCTDLAGLTVATTTEYRLTLDLSVSGTLVCTVQVLPFGAVTTARRTTNLPTPPTGIGIYNALTTLSAIARNHFINSVSLEQN